jgi:hypothetical protein
MTLAPVGTAASFTIGKLVELMAIGIWLSGSEVMISRIALVLAVSSLAALAVRLLMAEEDEAILERKAAGELDALREHLFKR